MPRPAIGGDQANKAKGRDAPKERCPRKEPGNLREPKWPHPESRMGWDLHRWH